jgi:predicted dehydrogenase
VRVGKTEPNDTRLVEVSLFALMMDHFAEYVHEKRPPKTPGEERLRDVRCIDTTDEAAPSGRVMKL